MTALAFHRALQRVLPARFRARHGEAMATMFADEWDDSAAFARMTLVLRALIDITRTALALRIGLDAPRTLTHGERPAERFAGFAVDVRAAVRSLRQRPGFSATAIVTLALGIAATTAVFSVVRSTVLEALPVPEPSRLVAVWTGFRNAPDAEFLLSAAEFNDVRTDARTIDAAGAWRNGATTLESRDGRDARTLSLAFTIGDIYELVGARTELGRLPAAEDDVIGAPPLAILTHDFWQTAFGADPSVLNSSVRVGDTDVRIAAVLARGVELPASNHDVWIHTVLDPASWAQDRSGHGINGIVRLRPGASEADLSTELAMLQARWTERYAGQHTVDGTAHVLQQQPLADRVLGTARRVAVLLSVASILLLMLAAANVANLLLARGETRTSEVGVRLALGSSRARVARPVLAEGVLLSICGGALGLALTAVGLPALLRLAPAELADATPARVDVTVASFTLLASLATGMLFSLLPAWAAARRDPATLLRSSGRGRTAASRSLRALILGQTALATLLLCAAMLLTRSLQQLNATSPGIEPANRIALDITLPFAAYPEAAQRLAFWETALGQLAQLPQIADVSLVRSLPLRDGMRSENTASVDATRDEDVISIDVQAAGPAALTTLGARLAAGRDLTTADREGSARAVVVNRTAARALWPDRDPIGQQLIATFSGLGRDPWTVVGVYEDVRSNGLAQPARPEMMFPLGQLAATRSWTAAMTLVARTNAPSAQALEAVRAALRTLDPNVPIEAPTTMTEVLRAASARERFLSTLLGVFAALATVIAAVGVFGVVSFMVARQRREFAIRNALGAGRGGIVLGVLRTNALVAIMGALLGGGAAWLAAPMLASFLYNVAPRDGRILAATPALLIVVALISSLPGALRAARVDPATAMNE